MTGPEAKVEAYLKACVEDAGGECIKIKASGVKGVPDRIVIINGVTCFVELKSKSGKLSMHQRKMFSRIHGAGGIIFVLDDKDRIDDFIVFALQDFEDAVAEESLILLPNTRLDS